MLLGKIIRPHGLKGLLRVQSYADSEDSFLNAGAVFLKSEEGLLHEYAVISANRQRNGLVLALDGIDTRDEAEGYRGCGIFIKRDVAPRGEDEYFWDELIGLKVYLENGDFLGNISKVIPTAGNDIFVIKDGVKEYYIPAIGDVVEEIDLENGRMTILFMEGLLDLNEV
jgi:16S rRNA processing protein RimM